MARGFTSKIRARLDQRQDANDVFDETEEAPTSKRDESGRGGTHGWAPFAAYAELDEDLRVEVCAIEVALRAHERPLDRETLKRETNSLRWGPGRFAQALAEATDAGVVKRVGWNRFALSSEAREAGQRAPGSA